MAVTTEIPWGDGSGDKIYLTRNASEGDQVVQVSSDANSGAAARTKVVTFTSGVGNIQRQLTINQAGVPEQYIVFADPVVEQICATKWGDGIGIKPSQAAQVTNSQFGTTFMNNTQITSFDELQYFTGLTQLSSAFRGCSSLQSVILPDLQTIGYGSFRDCPSLVSIDIPATVTVIDSASFYGCSHLYTIVLRSNTPPRNAYANTFQNGPAGRKYYVPYSEDHSVIDLYKATSRWNALANSIYELNPDGTIPT